MTNDFNRKLLCAAAAALTGFTFVAASAAQAETANVREVSYADLNLKADAGKATLAARVRGAAEAVCNAGGRTLVEVKAEKKCVESAVQAAMSKAASIS